MPRVSIREKEMASTIMSLDRQVTELREIEHRSSLRIYELQNILVAKDLEIKKLKSKKSCLALAQ